MQYTAEGPIQTITQKIDNGDESLITVPANTDIPIKTTPGFHALTVKGNVNEFNIKDSVVFQIGKKNISVNKSSINYTYQETATEGIYDVTPSLQVTNSGDIDVLEVISVRFDHITPAGDVTSQTIQIPTLAVKESFKITLPSFQASFGDILSVTIDPDSELQGEYKDDNSTSLVFQTGQILAVTGGFPDDNVYLEGVSLFNPIKVDTAGPIAYVEYQTNSIIFVDNTPENGFNSIVDMGLLSAEDNYVKIIAYGDNGIVLDAYNYYFKMKRVNEKFGGLKFPWGFFTSSSSSDSLDKTASLTSSSLMSAEALTSTGRVIMSEIEPKDLWLLQSVTINNGMTNPSAIIPSIDSELRVIYQLVTEVNTSSDELIDLDLSGIPALGGNYKLPEGGRYIVLTTFDPTRVSATISGIINVTSSKEGYLKSFNDAYQETYEDILEEINKGSDSVINSIKNEELLMTFIREMIDQNTYINDKYIAGGNFLNFINYGNLFLIHLDFLGLIGNMQYDEENDKPAHTWTNLVGAYFFGTIDFFIDGDVYFNKPEFIVAYNLAAELSYTWEKPGNIFEIEGQATCNLDIDTTLVLGTPSAKASIEGEAGLTLFNVALFPMVHVVGSAKIHAQQFRIPLHADMDSSVTLKDGILTVSPFCFGLHKNISHHSRIADAQFDVAINPLMTAFLTVICFGIPVGAYAHADITVDSDINGKIDIDLIAGMSRSKNTISYDILYYGRGRIQIDANMYLTVFLRIFWHVFPIYHVWIDIYDYDSDQDDNVQPSGGTPYSQAQVDQLIQDYTWELPIPPIVIP